MRSASSLRVDGQRLVARARALPDALSDVDADVRALGGDHPIVARVEAALIARARRIAAE